MCQSFISFVKIQRTGEKKKWDSQGAIRMWMLFKALERKGGYFRNKDNESWHVFPMQQQKIIYRQKSKQLQLSLKDIQSHKNV